MVKAAPIKSTWIALAICCKYTAKHGQHMYPHTCPLNSLLGGSLIQANGFKKKWIRIQPSLLLQVSKKNLMEIVKKLMLHMDKAEGSHYRDELLAKIIEICSQSNYQFITNFEWSVCTELRNKKKKITKSSEFILNMNAVIKLQL